MLLKSTHQTDLSYSDLISESVMELRMAPRQERDQHRLSFNLAIGPPTQATSYFDWLGNWVHSFTVNAFHNQIRIVATSVVEVDRPAPDIQQLPDRWPVPADACDYAMYDYLQLGGPVCDSPELRQLADSLEWTNGMPLGEIAQKMLNLIDQRFTYKKGVTTAASPITEMLQHGHGVCQDFTHLMIGLARTMQIPARYVSGFIHGSATDHVRGAAQTHAWCELLFPTVGWIGFDPANKCTVGSSFVKVAVGRDFRDVPPNKGLYRGKANETIEVSVHSEELPTMPPELAAEQFRSLAIPAYLDGSAARREMAARQQEHQEHQQQQ